MLPARGFLLACVAFLACNVFVCAKGGLLFCVLRSCFCFLRLEAAVARVDPRLCDPEINPTNSRSIPGVRNVFPTPLFRSLSFCFREAATHLKKHIKVKRKKSSLRGVSYVRNRLNSPRTFTRPLRLPIGIALLVLLQVLSSLVLSLLSFPCFPSLFFSLPLYAHTYYLFVCHS